MSSFRTKRFAESATVVSDVTPSKRIKPDVNNSCLMCSDLCLRESLCEKCLDQFTRWRNRNDVIVSEPLERSINCSNHGCDMKVVKSEMQTHRENECLFEVCECKFSTLGCKEHPIRRELESHHQSCTFYCSKSVLDIIARIHEDYAGAKALMTVVTSPAKNIEIRDIRFELKVKSKNNLLKSFISPVFSLFGVKWQFHITAEKSETNADIKISWTLCREGEFSPAKSVKIELMFLVCAGSLINSKPICLTFAGDSNTKLRSSAEVLKLLPKLSSTIFLLQNLCVRFCFRELP